MRICLWFALAAMACVARASVAAVTFNFAVDVPTTTPAPGSQLTLSVYLEEHLTDGSTSLINSQGGLKTAAFTLSRVFGETSPAYVKFTPAPEEPMITPNSAFDGAGGFVYAPPSQNDSPYVAGFSGSTSSSGHLLVVDGRILLAEITFQIGTVDFEWTRFRLFDDPDPFFQQEITTWSGTALDTQTAAVEFGFTPEPAIAGPLCVASALLLGRRKRLRG